MTLFKIGFERSELESRISEVLGIEVSIRDPNHTDREDGFLLIIVKPGYLDHNSFS